MVSLDKNIYYKQKPKQGKMWLQGTQKIGCMAHIEVKTFILYTEYAISPEKKEGISKWKMRCMIEEKMRELHRMLHTQNPIKTEVKYFVSFPLMNLIQDIPLAKTLSIPIHKWQKNHANDIIRDNKNN